MRRCFSHRQRLVFATISTRNDKRQTTQKRHLQQRQRQFKTRRTDELAQILWWRREHGVETMTGADDERVADVLLKQLADVVVVVGHDRRRAARECRQDCVARSVRARETEIEGERERKLDRTRKSKQNNDAALHESNEAPSPPAVAISKRSLSSSPSDCCAARKQRLTFGLADLCVCARAL